MICSPIYVADRATLGPNAGGSGYWTPVTRCRSSKPQKSKVPLDIEALAHALQLTVRQSWTHQVTPLGQRWLLRLGHQECWLLLAWRMQ